ncbi:unnamed protein product, partial [Tetraodon nigroviridis]
MQKNPVDYGFILDRGTIFRAGLSSPVCIGGAGAPRDLVKADVLNRAVDAEKENKETFSLLNGIFCAKMLTDGGNFLYQVSDGVEIVESVVSPSGAVVNCSVLFGYTNFKWHSISHCDCDEKLKACLRRVNDTSSRVVGQAFFNVIGVPCFDFAYEEQCAERHWYGLCKRYEKFPTAVLKTAVPYDYGGIDIIDELPLPSSKKTKEHQEEEEENASKTQSNVSGKWRKNKKQKAEPGGKADEGAAASASGSKGEVKGVSTFVGASHRRHPSGKRTVTEHQPVRKEEPLNEVMKDEPAVEKETVSVTPTPATEKKPETTTEILCPTTVSTRRKRTKQLRQREGKKTVPYLKEPPGNGTDISVTTSRASGPQQQSFRSIGRDTENQPGAGTAAPAVGPKVKRTRSEESGDREWRKKRRKDSSASPTEPTPNENKPAEHLKAIPLREAPAVPSDRDEGRAAVPDVPGNTSFSVLKTRKLKEKALRSSRRKAALAAA